MALNGPEQPYLDLVNTRRRILSRAYRQNQRTGDYRGALEAVQLGEKFGIPVGRRVRSEELQGVAQQDYADAELSAGREPMGNSDLDNFDSRHSSQGGPSVGGYDFSQKARVPSMAPVQRTGYLSQPGAGQGGPPVSMTMTKPLQGAPVSPTSEGGQGGGGYAATQPQEIPNQGGGYDFSQRHGSSVANGGSFYGAPDRRAAFSRAWQTAGTQDARDELVGRARDLGVPMDDGAAQESFERLGREKDLISNRPDTARADLNPRMRTAWDRQTAAEKGLNLTPRKRIPLPRT